MTITLQSLITSVRSAVDEPSARFYTDTELTVWINDGNRDLSRRTETLQSYNTSIAAAAGTALYTLPTNVQRLHRVEFVPSGSTQTYPMKPSTYDEMDQLWGINMNQQSSYPSYYCMWGSAGNVASDTTLQMRVFPVPAQSGTFNIYYYREPYQFLDPIANPGELPKTVEIVDGWWDLLVMYVEYRAKRKSRDPDWETAKNMYEEQVAHMIDMTRQAHDQQKFIMTASGFPQPMWLYADGEADW